MLVLEYSVFLRVYPHRCAQGTIQKGALAPQRGRTARPLSSSWQGRYTSSVARQTAHTHSLTLSLTHLRPALFSCTFVPSACVCTTTHSFVFAALHVVSPCIIDSDSLAHHLLSSTQHDCNHHHHAFWTSHSRLLSNDPYNANQSCRFVSQLLLASPERDVSSTRGIITSHR